MYKDNNNEVNDNDVNDNEFNDNEVNDNKVIENKVNDKKDKAKTLTSTRTNLRVQVYDFMAVLLLTKVLCDVSRRNTTATGRLPRIALASLERRRGCRGSICLFKGL